MLEDFILANTHISVDGKKDTQLELLQETLVLSQQALIYDPYQLAPQMMNRLSSHTVMKLTRIVLQKLINSFINNVCLDRDGML